MEISISDINIFIKYGVQILNIENFIPISNVKPLSQADENSLVFIVETAKNKVDLINNTKAKVIICDYTPEDIAVFSDKCLLLTDRPKLIFAKVVNEVIAGSWEYGIHPTAVIHPEAKIAANVYIGPHVCIGKSDVGENTIIHSNVSIYDHVKIGQHVIIDSGAVIGAAGFGFVREENGIPVMFPQLGGVKIGDYVEIGANVCIDRGALQDTIIGNYTKIDNFSQISHNDVIGENNYIIGAVLAGSVTVGNNCWIAPSRIMNKKVIGDDVTVGFGSVVLNNLESGSVSIGNPAMRIEDYSKLQFKLKKLLKK